MRRMGARLGIRGRSACGERGRAWARERERGSGGASIPATWRWASRWTKGGQRGVDRGGSYRSRDAAARVLAALLAEGVDAAEDAEALADGEDGELFEGGEIEIEQNIALDVIL